jgi:hypothetical protein
MHHGCCLLLERETVLRRTHGALSWLAVHNGGNGQIGGWAGELGRAVDGASTAQGRPAGGAVRQSRGRRARGYGTAQPSGAHRIHGQRTLRVLGELRFSPRLTDAWLTWVGDGPVSGPDGVEVIISIQFADQDLPFPRTSGDPARRRRTEPPPILNNYAVCVRRMPDGPVERTCSFPTETAARWHAVELTKQVGQFGITALRLPASTRPGTSRMPAWKNSCPRWSSTWSTGWAVAWPAAPYGYRVAPDRLGDGSEQAGHNYQRSGRLRVVRRLASRSESTMPGAGLTARTGCPRSRQADGESDRLAAPVPVARG